MILHERGKEKEKKMRSRVKRMGSRVHKRK